MADGAVRRHCIVIVETEYINKALWNIAGTDVTGAMKAGREFVNPGCNRSYSRATLRRPSVGV